MQGVNVFCERCGSLQPRPETSTARSAGVLARRVLDAVGITESQAQPGDDWLRLCLNCRGYSCPACWNDADGVCQTCAPLPEPVHVAPPEPAYVTLAEPWPVFEAKPELAYVAETELAGVAQPEPDTVLVAAPEPVAATQQIGEPEPVLVADLAPEPAVAELAPEPIAVAEPAPEAEPVAVAEPTPEAEPIAVAEPAPEAEPVAVAEPTPEAEPIVVEPAPEPATRPAPPRMPILPLPRPRPADAPMLPLPTLPAYPVAPQIAFSEQTSATASVAAAEPAYQQHSLLAPPPDTSHVTSAGLRPCRNCELSLSARARFCRRCGTAQVN
jgi:hypothetical protein